MPEIAYSKADCTKVRFGHAWSNRTLTQEFYRLKIVHPEFQPHWAWYFSKCQRKLLSPCTSVIQMTASLTDTRHNILCAACDSY